MRLARSNKATGTEKIQAEGSAWKVLKEMYGLLAALGYLKFSEEDNEEKKEKSRLSSGGNNYQEIPQDIKEDMEKLLPPERQQLRKDLEKRILSNCGMEEEVEDGIEAT